MRNQQWLGFWLASINPLLIKWIWQTTHVSPSWFILQRGLKGKLLRLTNTMLHGVIPNNKGMSHLNPNSKELQRPNPHLVEQIDLFQLLPNNWMWKVKLWVQISPLLLLQPPNARQARLNVLSVVVISWMSQSSYYYCTCWWFLWFTKWRGGWVFQCICRS